MNILLVDDHPMTLEGYTSALLNGPFSDTSNFTKAYNCEEACLAISKRAPLHLHYDLAIIDYGLPAYKEKNINSGGDLAGFIRLTMPNCKIIMITAHTEIIIIYEIVKKIRPQGLIIKNDVTPEILQMVVKTVIEGDTYQSPIVKSAVNEIWKKQLMIDDNNRQVLLYLSKGFKVKELEELIFLTTSTIQKRIILMKKAFEVSDNSGLIKAAVKQGFI